jgi:hypothetical protein
MDALSGIPNGFVAAARGFCAWCEGSEGVLSNSDAAYWLGRLYAEATRLPEVAPETEEDLAEIPAAALAKAKANFVPFWGRYYRKCFDPAPESSEEPVIGDLADDLLDTYLDVRRGLALFEAGEENDALWHWSSSHRTHWGQHAAGALYALHCLSLSQWE